MGWLVSGFVWSEKYGDAEVFEEFDDYDQACDFYDGLSAAGDSTDLFLERDGSLDVTGEETEWSNTGLAGLSF